MRAETNIGRLPHAELGAAARRAESAGFWRISHSEVIQDAFLSSLITSQATRTAGVATSVAIAFPRSPMITAYTARNIQDISRGRFVLGLGTQVRGHIERRFSSEFRSPGPRLREYVEALDAIFRCWKTGEPLSYTGKYYRFSLMTPEFSPGPGDYPSPPVQIAAVNSYNLALAGELCAGVRLHPFMTAEYARSVALGQIGQGLTRAGRRRQDIEVVGGGFMAMGHREDAVLAAREAARRRVGFYASTRVYHPVLAHHGWGEVAGEARRLSLEGRWDELSGLIDDGMLDAFCVSGTPAEVAAELARRWGGVADTIIIPADAWMGHPDEDAAALIAQLRDSSPEPSRG